MYPRAKLTSFLWAIGSLLSGTNQFLGEWVPSLCSQTKPAQKEGRKGDRKGELTPRSNRQSSQHISILLAAEGSTRAHIPTKWTRRSSHTLNVSKKGWGDRITQENISHCCLSSSSLKITLSPLSVLQGAFDLNIGISRLSRGIAEAVHGTNRVNKTDRRMADRQTDTHTQPSSSLNSR